MTDSSETPGDTLRYLPAIALVLSSLALAATPSDESVAEVVKRYFGDSTIAGGANANFPRFLVADLNGDGEEDLVVALADKVTAPRGEGCYALGIVNSFRTGTTKSASYHGYECYKAYEIATLASVPLKMRSTIVAQFTPSGSCVRLTLRYDDQPLICWRDRGYREF